MWGDSSVRWSLQSRPDLMYWKSNESAGKELYYSNLIWVCPFHTALRESVVTVLKSFSQVTPLLSLLNCNRWFQGHSFGLTVKECSELKLILEVLRWDMSRQALSLQALFVLQGSKLFNSRKLFGCVLLKQLQLPPSSHDACWKKHFLPTQSLEKELHSITNPQNIINIIINFIIRIWSIWSNNI